VSDADKDSKDVVENTVAVVPQRLLDMWARTCHDIYADLTRVEAALLHRNDVHGARESLHPAREDVWHTMQSLIRAGAERPGEVGERSVSLPQLTSAANRRLMDSLREAVDAAEATDAERGRTAPSGRTERLRLLLEAVETEVLGPVGAERGE